MYRTLIATASLALLTFLTACGDFADRKVCTPNAAPGCVPDFNDFEVPDLNGPNPNFPDPNVNIPSRSDSMGPEAHLFSTHVVEINEIMLEAGSQFVEIRHQGEVSVSLEGYTLRSADQVFALSGELANDEYSVIEFGEDLLKRDAGSLALFNAEGMMMDFVQWGAGGQALEAEAVLEGQWTPGNFCLTPEVENASISYFADYGPGNTSANWWAQVPSAGAANPPRENVPSYSNR